MYKFKRCPIHPLMSNISSYDDRSHNTVDLTTAHVTKSEGHALCEQSSSAADVNSVRFSRTGSRHDFSSVFKTYRIQKVCKKLNMHALSYDLFISYADCFFTLNKRFIDSDFVFIKKLYSFIKLFRINQ